MASKKLLVPREHGAWAVLLMPFVVGVGVAGRIVPETALFLVAALCWFAARQPVSLLYRALVDRAKEAQSWRVPAIWLTGYCVVGTFASLLLLFRYARWGLLPIGAAALLLLAVQPLLQHKRLDRTVAGELLAFAGLTLSGPGAYYVSSGRLDSAAAMIWVLTFLYTGSSIFYVKLRVRQRARRDAGRRVWLGRDMALYQTVLIAALSFLASTNHVPWLALLAFVPLTYKVAHALWHRTPQLNLRRLGYVEVAHSVSFMGLLIAAYLVKG